MFLILEEIFHHIRRHKTRTLLTGFGVAWGMFILIVIVGGGESLKKGTGKFFTHLAPNSLWFWGGRVSLLNEDLKEGERIRFNESLLHDIKKRYHQEISFISPVSTFAGAGGSNAQYNDNVIASEIKGVYPEYNNIHLLEIGAGRALNFFDLDASRSTCVIGSSVKQILFRNDPNPIGKSIFFGNQWFKVVGFLKDGAMNNRRERNSIFIPFSTFQNSFDVGLNFSLFTLKLRQSVTSAHFEQSLRAYIAYRYGFNKNDQEALGSFNVGETIKEIDAVFYGISFFLWCVGICLLLSGMVGISNMMLVIVKERTKEIGIRKAIGAKPRSILKMILYESMIITLLAGLVGIGMAYLLIQGINLILAAADLAAFDNLEISFGVTVNALILVVIAGCIAGYAPARKATKIMPVSALNIEN